MIRHAMIAQRSRIAKLMSKTAIAQTIQDLAAPVENGIVAGRSGIIPRQKVTSLSTKAGLAVSVVMSQNKRSASYSKTMVCVGPLPPSRNAGKPVECAMKVT